MNNLYHQQVEILLKTLPVMFSEDCFAIHGGTAINLFVKNLPRYSVDIDLTYIPLEDRDTSILNMRGAMPNAESVLLLMGTVAQNVEAYKYPIYNFLESSLFYR